jgi:molecular chaperone GrpE
VNVNDESVPSDPDATGATDATDAPTPPAEPRAEPTPAATASEPEGVDELDAALDAMTAERESNRTGLAEMTAARDRLEKQLGALSTERDKLKEQLVRAAADFENFRRRSRTEQEDAKLRGKSDALLELLPVFDNLSRAVSAAKNAKDIASVVEGVRMVLKLFDDTAERIGLSRVTTVGERFDPAVHDAIQQVESAEQVPGTILSEVAAGYRFGKRLLRAAMVVVARAPAPPKVVVPEPVPEPVPESAAAAPEAAAAEPTATPSSPTTDATPDAGKPPAGPE